VLIVFQERSAKEEKMSEGADRPGSCLG